MKSWGWMVAALAMAVAGGSSATVIVPEAGDCAATQATIDLGKVTYSGEELQVEAGFSIAGKAFGSYLEYRIDSDRYRADIDLRTAGDVEKSFPFKLCGDHVFHFWVYPVVEAGGRHVVCLGNGTKAKALFNATCGNDIRLSDVKWECGSDGTCKGSAVAAIGDGKSDYLVMSSVGQAAFRDVAAPGPGPFQLNWTCKAGEQVRLRGRLSTAFGYLGVAELVCGKP